jgi:hypothetical protein
MTGDGCTHGAVRFHPSRGGMPPRPDLEAFIPRACMANASGGEGWVVLFDRGSLQ